MQLLGSFVQAEYPEEARAKGTEATVVLRLSIDSTGKVTEALLERGAGARFDSEAWNLPGGGAG